MKTFDNGHINNQSFDNQLKLYLLEHSEKDKVVQKTIDMNANYLFNQAALLTPSPEKEAALIAKLYKAFDKGNGNRTIFLILLLLLFTASSGYFIYHQAGNHHQPENESQTSMVAQTNGAHSENDSIMTNEESSTDNDFIASIGSKIIKPFIFIADEIIELKRLATSIFPSENEETISPKQNPFLDDLGKKLAGYNSHLSPERLYVQTDRPLYFPGETIWLAAYLRNEGDFKKPEVGSIIHVELVNPKGTVEKQISIVATNGKAVGDFHFDESMVGGAYKLKAYTNWQKNDANALLFERDIQLQKVVLPHLKMNLDFEEKGYGPGAEVSAKVKLETLENQPLSKKEFQYTVSIDGKEFLNEKMKTGSDGKAIIKFKLPAKLKTTDGLLNLVIEHEGNLESISRAVPIQLNEIQFELYPEGGDLVAGLETRIGFQALNEYGLPTDVTGVVLDESGNEVASFKSFHDGMGAFSFVPQADHVYKVRITKPDGITTLYDLPEIQKNGFVLNVDRVDQDYLHLVIRSTLYENVSLTVLMRGVMYYSTELEVKGGENAVLVPLKDFPMGVAHITLFDKKEIERAERLVFVNKHKQLNVEVKTDKEKYLPREKVQLTVTAKDERGMTMPADLALAVVDDKLLSFADDKSGNIFSKMLVEPDITGDVEEARFYFDPEEPRADRALDYLLMARGWRKFTWKEVLNQDFPSLKSAKEATTVSGKVLLDNRQPLVNLTVKVEDSGETAITDSSGRFEFKNLDLSVPRTLLFELHDKKQSVVVNDYKNNIDVNFPGGNFTYSISKEGNSVVGVIRDLETREPLIAVNVIVEGTGTGTITDLDGRFKLNLKPGTYDLRVAYIGYENLLIKGLKVSADKSISIEGDMVPSNVQLNQVIVSGSRVEYRLLDSPVSIEIINSNRIKRQDFGVVGRKKANEKLDVQSQVGPQLPVNVQDLRSNAIIGDPRVKQNTDTVNQNQKNVKIIETPIKTYYRAREFPKVVYKSTKSPEVRDDFRNTIYWEGNVRLDKNGKSVVEFYNSDAISSFRTTVEGIADDGSVGRAEKTYYTKLPFGMDVKLPTAVLVGDKFSVPLTFKNDMDVQESGKLVLEIPDALKLLSSAEVTTISVPLKEAKTIFLDFEVLNRTGKFPFRVSYVGDNAEDAFEQPLEVRPRGFPASVSFGGSDLSKEFIVNINEPLEGSIEAGFTAYPTVMNDILAGIESILREPYGCFEQTSSSTYPNVLVLQYLKEIGSENEEAKRQALQYIRRGYDRLAGFECKGGGFEWFGNSPANEALTAYGVLEFTDMEKIYNGVSKEMLQRTVDWLLSRRDGKGGFKKDSKHLDSFGGSDDQVANAYIVYALTEAGHCGIYEEIDASYKAAVSSNDAYQIALVANSFFNILDKKRGDEMVARLLKMQGNDGSWTGKPHSMTCSTGKSLTIETTALAVSALLKSTVPDQQALKSATNYLQSNRSSYGGFGSTQGTILTLRALVAYAKFAKRTQEPGAINVWIDDQLAQTLHYEPGEEVIGIDGLGKYLSKGEHKIRINYAGVKNAIPYSMGINWMSLLPANAEQCKVHIETALGDTIVNLGNTVRLNAVLENQADENLPMTLGIIGIPAGLSLQPWQLNELKEKKAFDYYEIIGNNLVVYYTTISPNERREIQLDLKSEMPGDFKAEASTAYLYYTNEYKNWEEGERVRILPR